MVPAHKEKTAFATPFCPLPVQIHAIWHMQHAQYFPTIEGNCIFCATVTFVR